MGSNKRQMDSPSRAVAFALAVGIIGAQAEYTFQTEFDIVDYANMDMKTEFKAWASEHSITFEDDEYARFAVWVENMGTIARHNTDGTNTWKAGANQFTHMTADEFKAYAGSYIQPEEKEKTPLLNKLKMDKENRNVNNPSSVDWDAAGKVTPVKDQGQCGSCWAFSTTGSLECNYAIQKGTLNSLSEQQLVDCSHRYGNLGCSGGQMDAAFHYVEDNGGLCSEKNYPYTASGGSCESTTCGTFLNANSGYTDVQARSDSSLENAAAAGCVSVAIEADQFAFQYYSSGVLTGTCGTSLDHGVLVVGYGTDSGTEYWKVKNSWGSSWGESGYVRICRNCNANGSQGECGINDDPSYPTFA